MGTMASAATEAAAHGARARGRVAVAASRVLDRVLGRGVTEDS